MLSTNIRRADDGALAEAGNILRTGGLVAFPTETVYGLGADATNGAAVARIFAVKGRPKFNPLIVHVPDEKAAKTLVEWNEAAELLAARFWPGPLTLVLPRLVDSPASLLASAGGDTLALRSPAHSVARALLKAAGVPIAAPSANRSGRISPTEAAHVGGELGEDVALILDGGPCAIGIESAVIDVSGMEPALLRPGSITQEDIEKVLGRSLALASPGDAVKSPGMLASHYAPSLPLRLNVTAPRSGEALLAFGPRVPSGAKAVFPLSESGDLVQAASHLFALLRRTDAAEFSGIAVMPIPEEGVGRAINDRLRRAAHS